MTKKHKDKRGLSRRQNCRQIDPWHVVNSKTLAERQNHKIYKESFMFWSKKGKELIGEGNDLIVRSPMNEELMKISVSPSNMNGKRKIEIPIGRMNNLLSAIPNTIGAKTLSESYRVIMPKGVSGELMKYKNGLQGTPVVGNHSKNILAHAGLKNLDPQAITLAGFTVASFATGQYFMAEINGNINRMKSSINHIQRIIENREESEFEADMYFMNYIDENILEIKNSDNHKLASLINIQSKTVSMLQKSNFYERQIKLFIGEMRDDSKKDEIEIRYGDIKRNIALWQLSTYCFFIGKTLEVRLSENYSPCYLKNVKSELSGKALFFKESVIGINDMLRLSLDESKYNERNAFQKVFGFMKPEYITKNEKVVGNLSSEYIAIENELHNEYENMNQIAKKIDNLAAIDKGFEILVERDALYVIK